MSKKRNKKIKEEKVMENEIRNEETVETVKTLADEIVAEELTVPMVEENVTPEVTEEVIEEGPVVTEETPEVIEGTTEDVEPEVTNEEIQNDEITEDKPELVIGVVGPAHLNVRKEASKDADIIGIVNKDDEIQIVGEVEDFYRVLLNGVEGFCVKEFISVK